MWKAWGEKTLTKVEGELATLVYHQNNDLQLLLPNVSKRELQSWLKKRLAELVLATGRQEMCPSM